MGKIRRNLLVGLVVGTLFIGWWMNDFYIGNWRFRLFSPAHWSYVWDEFKSGWIIHSASDWVFVSTIVLLVPAFLVLWWISCKIRWRQSALAGCRKVKSLICKPDPKKVVRKKIKLKSKESHKKVRPKPINSIGRPAAKAVGRTMDAGGQGTPATPTPPVSPEFTGGFDLPNGPTGSSVGSIPQTADRPAFLDENDDLDNVSLDDIKLPERERLQEDVVSLLSGANYQVVRDVLMNKLTLAYVGVATDTIVLALADTEAGDWLADEEFFNEEEPLWFSENAHRISPVYRLVETSKSFQKKVQDAGYPQRVIPMLIEQTGTIINAADMAETWNKMNVIVCRTDMGGPEELPSVAAAVPHAADKGTAADLESIRNLF